MTDSLFFDINILARNLEIPTKTTFMKLKLLGALCLLTVTIVANAQKSGVYIKGGVNFANITISDDGDIDDTKSLTSFHLGLLADIPFNDYLALQPSLLFTGKGAKAQSGSTSDATYYRAKSNPLYVELPVNLIVKIPLGDEADAEQSRLFFGAGPYIAMGVGGKNKVDGKLAGVSFSDESSIDFSNDDPATGAEEGAGFGIMRRFDYGLNATAGFQFNKFILSANYGIGLAKLQSGANNSSDDNNKHRVLSFSVGFGL